MKAKVKETGEFIDVEQYECDHALGWNYMDWETETLYWEDEIEILEKPREIEMGKFASIDASGVKEIAAMQRYIDNLENYLWRMAMYIEGKDDVGIIIEFTEGETKYATTKIYDFIKEQKGKIEEIESSLTQSDDVDDIVYSYHQIESKIKEHKEEKK